MTAKQSFATILAMLLALVLLGGCSPSSVETPLLTSVQLGYGNEGLKTPEGFRYKNVIGSHLTGPILVKNPRLLDKVVSAIYEKRGEALPEKRPTNQWTEDGYAITAEQLKQRI